MHLLKKYSLAGAYGLTVYFTLRLLQDSVSGMRFWRRPWTVTALETGFSVVVGWGIFFGLDRLLAMIDKKSRARPGSISIAAEIACVVGFTEAVVNVVFTPLAAGTDDGLQWSDVVAINIIPLLYTLIYYGILRSGKWLAAFTEEKVKTEKLANDQLQTELKFLRAQYHPHFLFNALNTVYFQMDENVPEAKKTLERFAELLRYQLYDQQEMVPVQAETDYLKNYIAVQKVRSEDRLRLEVRFDSVVPDRRIYPLLLLPLVENAFKFVGGALALRLSLEWSEETLVFEAENSLGGDRPRGPGGIGLENLQRRLVLLYPGKHCFTQGRTDRDTWLARLTIDTTV